jgi:hypothetical protein
MDAVVRLCPQATNVERFLLDELDAPARQQFLEHCRNCTECAESLEYGRKLLRAIRREA